MRPLKPENRSHPMPAPSSGAGSSDVDAPTGATRRLVELEGRGATLSLLEWGDPALPLALFSHANGFCAALWAEVAEALQQRFHVVAVDARGQGHSPEPPGGVSSQTISWQALRDDLVELSRRLLAETGQSRVALGVGHSIGGTLTLAAAAALAPGRFDALLALDPVILPPRRVASGPENMLAAGARRRRAVFASRESARAGFAGKPFFANWTERALDLYVDFGLEPSLSPDAEEGEVVLRCSPETEASVFESSIDFDIVDEVARIDVPAGILWAAGGQFPREVHAGLAERMPLGWIQDADAGHLILMEKPGLVLEAIERVLRDAAQAR